MFKVTQKGQPDFDVTLDIGSTVKEAKANAEKLVEVIYDNAPTNDAVGQTFKNEFTFALLAKSGRCRQAAGQVLGTGKAKAVKGQKTVTEEKECCQ